MKCARKEQADFRLPLLKISPTEVGAQKSVINYGLKPVA